jgi:S-formylglutathione hydrolase FrmB
VSRAIRQENRAMADLSMGGGRILTTALNNPDKFAYQGDFSLSCGGRGATFDPQTSWGLADRKVKAPKTLAMP